MSDALMRHLKRALYQASYCSGLSLVTNQDLPDLCLLGRKNSENGFKVHSMTLPEASVVYRELVHYGYNKEKALKEVENAQKGH